MSDILFSVSGTGVTVGAVALAAFALLTLVLLGAIATLVARAGRTRGIEAATQALRAEDMDLRMGDIARAQAETAGRLQAMHEALATRQSELARVMSERLDSVTHRLGESMTTSTKHTVENLQKLNERLAVIDTAQRNITDLASQMTSLHTVLSNKQSRGAFGQSRLEIIVQDGLPKGFYEFQATLSNRSRPDCCVYMPNQPPLVIDAKFPLEAISAYRDAKTDDERNIAARQLRQDVNKHVADIAEKYLLPGETQDIALMFIPSESVYAELYDGFDDIVQKAFRSRVMIVSPSLLMLAIQVIQQVQKDARMREAADQIRAEVGHLMDDLGRLRERVNKLGAHFNQANEDVRQILISAEKVEKHGVRIRDVEFSGGDGSGDVIPAPIRPKLQAGE